MQTVLGLELGLYAWALLAAAGFASLVAASEIAFLVLRVVGAVGLIVLGLRAWQAAWRDRATGESGATAPAPSRPGWGRSLGEGLVGQLADPKAAVFMLAFYPQFVPADRPLFATTAVLGATASRRRDHAVCVSGRWRQPSRPMVSPARGPASPRSASGTVLVALGLRVAVTSR